MLHPKQPRQLLFESFPFRTKREPKVQGRGDRRFHFVFCENTPRVGHSSVARYESRAQRIVTRTIGRVSEAGILSGQSKDFLLQFRCVHKNFLCALAD